MTQNLLRIRHVLPMIQQMHLPQLTKNDKTLAQLHKGNIAQGSIAQGPFHCSRIGLPYPMDAFNFETGDAEEVLHFRWMLTDINQLKNWIFVSEKRMFSGCLPGLVKS